MRDFDKWLGTFTDTIATYGHYCDFEKCVKNANKHRFELHLMNALIGQPDVEKRFREMATKHPRVIKAVPTLLAVRQRQIIAQDANGKVVYDFRDTGSHSLDEYCYFMDKTGLFDLISRRLTSNLYDYAVGVEVGLDSNTRKNRTGKAMENIVESHIEKAGFTFVEEPGTDDTGVYTRQMKLTRVEHTWGIDLSALSNNGGTEKNFDFVVRTESCVYGVEVNFYSSQGSKLNETARSYKMLATESADIDGFKFVWVTDGAGWQKAKRNLRETFDALPDLYNLNDLENGALGSLLV